MAKKFISFKIVGLEKFKQYLMKQKKKYFADLEDVVDNYFHKEIVPDAQQNVAQKLKAGPGRTLLQANIRHWIKRTANKGTILASLGVLKRPVYAALHEYGGKIKSKRPEGFLTIPFPGVKKSAREYKNTFIAKGIIFQKLGLTKRGGQQRSRIRGLGGSMEGSLQPIKPLFTLVKSVRIPKRPYLRPAIIAGVPGLSKSIKKRFNKKGYK